MQSYTGDYNRNLSRDIAPHAKCNKIDCAFRWTTYLSNESNVFSHAALKFSFNEVTTGLWLISLRLWTIFHRVYQTLVPLIHRTRTRSSLAVRHSATKQNVKNKIVWHLWKIVYVPPAVNCIICPLRSTTVLDDIVAIFKLATWSAVAL